MLFRSSWAKKLNIKMKKLFCMESHGQYMTHVAEKKARGRHKELMRQMGAIVISGSEDQLTEEEEWIFSSTALGLILMLSTSRLTMVAQMIPLRSDGCPSFTFTWSRSITPSPFWCLDAKGGESLGICALCLPSFVFVLSLVALFGLCQ